MNKPLLAALKGVRQSAPPIWLMRQAGRYLPEYRALRAEKGGFLALATDPVAAAEVTMQPIRRFGFDGAILFSDILMVPWALGQDLTFGPGEGPRLAPPLIDAQLEALARVPERLEPVYATVARVAAMLPAETSFLGFAGSPWTVATYMVAGQGSRDQSETRAFAYRDPAGFGAIIDAIVAGLRARCPDACIIGFPKGIGGKLPAYARETGVDAIGLDETVDPGWADTALPQGMAVQGNLDPLALLAGGDALEAGIDRVLAAFPDRPHVFNLGHGIGQHTPIAHVERLIARVRGG